MAGIYIHFPFCLKKCNYCDFFSVEKQEEIIPQFIDALQKEIGLYSATRREDTSIGTIYLGGGTPSLLPEDEIATVLDAIALSFPVDSDPEITIEANPGTLSLSKLTFYREIGINRISIGIQSIHEDELELLGRVHNSSEGIDAIHMAREAGFDNINADLIYGLPGQTLIRWQNTLETIIALSPDHISAYTLTWDNETRMGQQIRSGILPIPDEDTVMEMYLATSEFLTEHGFEHYEISNFAKPGFRCKHNEGYWTGEPYFGLGPSAHSFLDNKRFWNIPDVEEYIQSLSENRPPLAGEETLDQNQQALEQLVLGLRTSEGVPLTKISTNQNMIRELIQNGLATEKNGHLLLNSKGFLLADEIALQLS